MNPQRSSIFEQFSLALRDIGVGLIDGSLEGLDEGFFREVLTSVRAPIIFDVGAHTGAFSRMALEIAPHGRVFAFEPSEVSFRHLVSSLSNYGPRFSARQVAIGERMESATLHYGAGETGSPLSSLYRDVICDLNKQDVESHPTQVVTLDALAAEYGVPTIHLLKLDMEGGELSALRGARQLLQSRYIQAIHFEFNDMNVISRTYFKDFWDLLSPQYTLHRLSPPGPIHITEYVPMYCELFAIQTIVALLK